MVSQKPIAKTRSPNYPAISLVDAIVHIRNIYREQKQYGATREDLAKLMGYKGLNGASATMVSALSKYELIEGYGDDLRVSNIGRDLAIHKPEDPEYAQAAEAAALAPAFFRELYDQYGTDLPSEHSLRTSLIKRGFNDKAIPTVVRAYRDTMDLVEEARSAANIAVSRPAETEEALDTATPTQPLRSLGAEAPAPGLQSFPFAVSSTKTVVVQIPESMSQSEWDLMMKYLDLLKLARVNPPAELPREQFDDE